MSKLKTQSLGIVSALIFYAVVGIVFFVLFPLANYPPHIGIMGILNLITAYGLFKKRAWSIWLVIVLFFVATTFSVYTIYSAVVQSDLLSGLVAGAYLITTWVFTFYTTMKRKVLES